MPRNAAGETIATVTALRVAALVIAGAIAAATAGAQAPPRTTVARTIVDQDGDNRLEYGAGEAHVVREDLAAAGPRGRDARRTPLLFFAQMTDLELLDEESPARVELFDRYPSFDGAYRPAEGLMAHVAEAAVRQLRAIRSPFSGRRLALAITTGDNVNNVQLNETRWFIDVLDGAPVLNPDSGVPGGCARGNGRLYRGRRGGGEFYEPDRSSRDARGSVDGAGYAPRASENRREAGRSVAFRDFPRLFEQMNMPFRASGLGIPWYSVFGNHDALVLGNVPINFLFANAAVGCLKPTRLPK